MPADQAADPFALEQFREYLNILASQQAALRFKGKGDLSGIVQETLWEAHQQLAAGCLCCAWGAFALAATNPGQQFGGRCSENAGRQARCPP